MKFEVFYWNIPGKQNTDKTEVISIGGTDVGADSAIVCLPKHGKDFFSFEVREVICKPRINK